jgi:hypothetical protein
VERPTPQQVLAARTYAVWALRSIGAALLCLGGYLVLKRVLFGIGLGDMSIVTRTYVGVGEDSSLYRGLALLVVGGLIAGLSTPIARWIVIVRPEGCPGCGYAAAADANQCPECGLKLADGRRS